MSEKDRRIAPRYIVNLPGRLCGSKQPELNVINLSASGALLLCSEALNAWDDICLEVEFPSSRKLRFFASVCWAEAGLVGVRFIRLEAEVTAFLERFLSNLEPAQVCGALD